MSLCHSERWVIILCRRRNRIEIMPAKSTKKRKRKKLLPKVAEDPEPENDADSTDDRSKSVLDCLEQQSVLGHSPSQDQSMTLVDTPLSSKNAEIKISQKSSEARSNDLPMPSEEHSSHQLTSAVVVQCSSCRTILADTTEGYLESNSETGTISFNAARRIDIADEDEISSTSWLRRCVFQRLSCQECGQAVGHKLNSTTTEFDSLRGAFTFDKSCLLTYQLGSCVSTERNVACQSSQKAIADANIAALQSLDDQIRMVSDALQSLAEGLECREMNNAKVHDTLLIWEEKFQRLENLENRLHKLIDNRLPAHSIAVPSIGIDSSAQRLVPLFDDIRPSAPRSEVDNMDKDPAQILRKELHGQPQPNGTPGAASVSGDPARHRGNAARFVNRV